VSVAALCRRYQVTRAGFYAARRRGESAHHQQNRDLSMAILRVFRAHRGRYGSPRIWRVLQAEGWSVSRRRIAQLMHAAGLRARAVRGYRAKAKIHQLYARHPNRLWDLSVTRVNQVCVGDITFLKVDSGWRYLAIVMDQYSRRILGWTLTKRRTSAVTCQALNKAAAHRPTRGVIFHSDRGSEYMGAAFGERLVALGLQQSAHVRGPGDNAHAESFFHTLKAELTRGVHLATDRHLRGRLQRYMTYYNLTRLHSALDYVSPIAFEGHAA
jgi:putative transposase